MKQAYYIGLDVHKDSIAIAYARSNSRQDPTYVRSCGGSNLSIERALRKLAKELKVPFQELHVCYEAGPTGFVLARRLRQLKVNCVVMSPDRSQRKPGDKVKTDKKDAIKIAKEFRNGDIVKVRVPPATDEAIRDLCRARTDASDDLSRSKKRLNSFLLRIGFNYTGKTRWTENHLRYLRELTMPHDSHKVVLEEYLQAIVSCQNRVDRIVDRMKLLLQSWEWRAVVEALMACRGYQEVAAMTLTSELGDLRRFKHPRKLMAYVGVVPGEDTSGPRRRQDGITKCGNSHARWMLVECSQHSRKAPKLSRALSKRQEGQSEAVKELSWRMQTRLNKRYLKLKMRGKRENKIIVAIARETCGFLWELQNKLDIPMPEPMEDTTTNV